MKLIKAILVGILIPPLCLLVPAIMALKYEYKFFLWATYSSVIYSIVFAYPLWYLVSKMGASIVAHMIAGFLVGGLLTFVILGVPSVSDAENFLLTGLMCSAISYTFRRVLGPGKRWSPYQRESDINETQI